MNNNVDSVKKQEKRGRILRNLVAIMSLPFVFLAIMMAWRRRDVHWTSPVFDMMSSTLREIRRGAASWRALDIIYHKRIKDDESFLGREIARFWLGMRNAKAVRNRFELTTRELEQAIREQSRQRPNTVINVFSIASGSAEAVVRAVLYAKKYGIVCRVYLLDKDPTAINYSTSLAKEAGVYVTAFETDVRSLEEVVQQLPPLHVIEMVGFLDYRSRAKAVNLISRIRKIMATGGVFITAQIQMNLEWPLMMGFLRWPMVYRSERAMRRILEEAGFKHYRLYCEAQRIHMIVVCNKE